MIIRVKKPHIIIIANSRKLFFSDSCNSCDSCSFKNSQIRDKKSVPGWLFCEAFFYSKNWSLFLFMKGVARPCRALGGHGCNGECSHSQRHPGHFSPWCSAPTPFLKSFFFLIKFANSCKKTKVRKRSTCHPYRGTANRLSAKSS